MSSLPSGLLTVREIAEQVGAPKHQVQRVLRELQVTEFRPAFRAGQTQVFDPRVVPYVRARIKALEAARTDDLRFSSLNEEGSA